MPRSPDDPLFAERLRRPVFESGPDPRRAATTLTPGDWAVLGLVAEGETHGFALAAELGEDGPLGRIWSVPRPVVYQSLKKLGRYGLVTTAATERSQRGPVRTIVAVTPSGRRLVEDWLAAPVPHVRDMRSLFLVKLALLGRAGRDPGALLAAQRHELGAGLVALADQRQEARGTDRVMLTWRWAAHRAAIDFIDAVALDHHVATPSGPHLR